MKSGADNRTHFVMRKLQDRDRSDQHNRPGGQEGS